jgi:hypothetical protein
MLQPFTVCSLFPGPFSLARKTGRLADARPLRFPLAALFFLYHARVPPCC